MKYPLYEAKFTLPGSGEIYHTRRRMQSKQFLEEELIKNNAKIIEIKLVQE